MENARKIAVLIPIFVGLLLGSCHKKGVYTDELSAKEVADGAVSAMEEASLLSAERDYLDDYILVPEGMTDREIRFSSNGNNLDEIGVWHVPTGETERIHALLEEYLNRSLERNRAFYDSYIPQETAKLRDAEVKTFGNYVVYAIMNEGDRSAFFESVSKILQANN